VEWDLDYRITDWNPAAERIFGCTKDNALGADPGKMIPAYEVDHIRNLFKDIVNHRNSRKNINKNITKDGKIITCEWYNKSLLDTDGTPIGIVAIGNDITDKVLMEEKMEKANRVKDNFLANVSHELRTPLNGAIGMIELLRNLEQTEESSYYLDLAAQSVDRLFSIVKDLLDFVQIDSGKLGLIVESFDFDKMMAHTIGLFNDRLQEKDLSISSRNQGNEKVFTGDRTRTAQIIISLLSNAVKFSNKGTIAISYSIDPDLNISIADEGIGIAEEEIDDIFNTLEQLEDPYTKKYDGLGLGLAIVKNLIDLMEGELTVKSELGKGTVFHITIPVSKIVSKQTDIKEKSDRKSTVSPEDVHILIAEDEGINRIFIREILKKNKFPVIEAKNGKEVLDLVKTQSTDLILMDIGMPVLSGLDATIELRKMEEFKKIPILALTAYTGKDDITRFLSAGFNEVLAKPINENNLIEKIKEYTY
jgi:PAS domain S-box-containing protein